MWWKRTSRDDYLPAVAGGMWENAADWDIPNVIERLAALHANSMVQQLIARAENTDQ
jgi:hypothetical protein